MRLSGVGGLLLTLGLLAGSCARVLGDVEIEPYPLQPNAEIPEEPDAGFAALGCEVGESRCRGPLAELCVRLEPEQPGSFRMLQDCLTDELCVSEPEAHCILRSCDAGEVACVGAVPQSCNASQTGWDVLPECLSDVYCSTSDAACPEGAPCCLTDPCEPGEMRCNQGEMQRCSADQTAWERVDSCATAELCANSLADCGASPEACACQAAPCEDGQTRCNDATLERCNAGRTGWEVVEPCASDALCEAGRALAAPSCIPPICELGSHACTPEGVLQSCRGDRSGFENPVPCIGAPFCNPGAGVCEEAPCDPGEKRCNGAQIEVCLEDQTGYAPDGPPCATPALCNESNPAAVRCEDPSCSVNEFSCFGGAQLQTCNDGRTEFVNVGAACPRPDLCSGERRRCDFCVPGRQECTIELDATRVCSLSGNFFGVETPCPLGCDGPLGQCRTCTVGSYTCNGDVIARCNDGRSFTPLNRASDCSGQTELRCNNGQLIPTNCGANGCNAGRGSCNECAGQQRRCAGLGFQQCNLGTFGPAQACEDGLECRGAGVCACDPLAPRCIGDVLQACNAVGSAFEPSPACAGEDGSILRTCLEGQLSEVQCSSEEDCEAAEDGGCE